MVTGTDRKIWRDGCPSPLTVYFDADCGFCTDCARLLRLLDGRRRLRLIPLQRAQRDRPDAPALATLQQSMHVVESDRRWTGGRACLEIAARVPALWPLATLRYVPLVPELLDRAYVAIAAKRHSISRLTGSRACRLDWTG
jgi:predicted DCC family thiol-disulfide oxidoreductase YuxK